MSTHLGTSREADKYRDSTHSVVISEVVVDTSVLAFIPDSADIRRYRIHRDQSNKLSDAILLINSAEMVPYSVDIVLIA